MRRRAAVLAFLLVGVCVPALHAQTAQTGTQKEKEEDPWFRPPNSIRLGEFRLDLRVRLHQDFKRFSPDLDFTGWEPTFRRARVGVQGRIYDDLEYDLDAELRDKDHPWRNVYLNYRRFQAAEVRVGRFKVPFGREQLETVFEIDFLERSLINSTLTPTRSTGLMVAGELAEGVVEYRTGIFRDDGDSSRFEAVFIETDRFEDVRAGEGSWGGRIVVRPWERSRGRLRRLEAGAGITLTDMDTGLFGPEGRTLSGYTFSEPVYVNGRRTRLGVDGAWAVGPFGVQAEYIRLQDQRNGQGLGDVDLPDAVAQGWYVSGSWNLTGERATQENTPRRPLFRGGIGALELAARIEALRFGSVDTAGEAPFANPRAANILENRDRIVSLGLNWYPNRWGRVMLNFTREEIKDPERSPILGRTTFWGTACRLQLVL